MIEQLEKNMDDIRLNGHRTQRLPNNVNISIEGIEGESIMLSLSYPTAENARPVFMSTGSACVSGTLEPSHILLALGLPAELAHGSVRFSLSRHDTRGRRGLCTQGSVRGGGQAKKHVTGVQAWRQTVCYRKIREGCDCEAAS